MPRREEDGEVLGVRPNAGIGQVRRAYRKLAMKYHPDVCKDPDAARRFVRIREAYDNLIALELRRKARASPPRPVRPGQAPWQPPILNRAGTASTTGAATPAEMARAAMASNGNDGFPLQRRVVVQPRQGRSFLQRSSLDAFAATCLLLVTVMTIAVGIVTLILGFWMAASVGSSTEWQSDEDDNGDFTEGGAVGAGLLVLVGLLLSVTGVVLVIVASKDESMRRIIGS